MNSIARLARIREITYRFGVWHLGHDLHSVREFLMLGLRYILLALTLLLPLAVGSAEARNVPGSAGAVQGRVDREVAGSMVDATLSSALAATQYTGCEQQRENPSSVRLNACEWGLSAKALFLFLSGDPDGYEYDSTTNLGSIMLARWISDDTVLIGGIQFERSETDTSYNNGGTEHTGGGGTIGIIHHFSQGMALNLFGGFELLNYDVSRSGGLFTGEYDATRLFLDASLSGQSGTDSFWLLYRGGFRLLNQNNEDYDEESGGVVVNHIDDIDVFTLAFVGDVKLGTTFDSIRPYLQFTTTADLVHNESLSSFGFNGDDLVLTGRIGAGFDALVLGGTMSFSGGAYFGDGGYAGADLLISFTKSF